MNKKQVALFDIDKTIYNQHSFFPAAKFLIKKGLFLEETWSLIEVQMTKYASKEQSYSDTANNLLAIFGKALEGKKYIEVFSAVQDFFAETKDNFYQYFRDILPALKATHDIYLVTTNSQMFAGVVKEIFGLDGYLCTNYEVFDGVFTGKILNSLADGKHVVEELLTKYEGKSIAVGDSENDIGMLEKVAYPICINPTDELLKHAQEKGWLIVNESSAYGKISEILSGKI